MECSLPEFAAFVGNMRKTDVKTVALARLMFVFTAHPHG